METWLLLLVMSLAYALFLGMLTQLVPRFLEASESFRLPVRGLLAWLARAGDLAPYWGPIVPILLVAIGVSWARSGRASGLQPGRSSWVPAFLPARAVAAKSAQINACPDGGRGQKLPKYGGDDILWGGCRPGRQVSADPYSGSMRRTNCGSQTRSWMTPSSRGAVVRRYFSSSGVAFANTQGTARRMWR